MFVRKKMHSLEELVARDHPIAAFRTNHGGVMPDTKAKDTTCRRRNPAAYSFNQLVFEDSQ